MQSGSTRVSPPPSFFAAPWTISRAANSAAWVVSVWGILYPRPYALLVLLLLAMPWVAVMWVRQTHGVFRIDHQRRRPRPNLSIPFVMPGMALLLRGVFDYHALDWARLIAYGFGIGSALCFAGLGADSSIRKWRIAPVFTMTLIYGMGAAMVANGFFDVFAPTTYHAEILDKRVVHGKAIYYQLTVSPWGPRTTENRIEVSRELYQAVSVGGPVCANVNHGALGVRWYDVTACH